jgi:hypothetical protein
MGRVLLLGGSLLALGLASGCGYSLAGQGRPTDPTIKVIGVPLFKDTTGKTGLDQKLTSKVIEELLKRGGLKVIQDTKGVNALVVGEITGYNIAPVGFAGDPTKGFTLASRYSITLTARVKYLKDGVADPLWANDAFSFKDEYDVGDPNQFYFDQESISIERLCTDFARSLVTNMFEAF